MDMKLPLVLYGAGSTAKAEMEFVRKNGMNPVCFCDADIEKQGTQYLGLPIKSFLQVQEEYNDFIIYVTPLQQTRNEIFLFLLNQGFKRSRILNSDVPSFYSGCPLLESDLAIDSFKLFWCCQMNCKIKQAPVSEYGTFGEDDCGVVDAISRWVKMRDDLIRSIRNDESSECSGCCRITKLAEQPEKKYLRNIHFCFEYKCQLACIYCSCRKNISEDKERFMRMFDYKRFVEILEGLDMLNKHTLFNIATEEISINPRKDEILDAVEKYKVMINTNAVIFDKRIAKFGERPGNCFSISPDAGTRETYKLIKGLDVFDKVWGNIMKYAKYGATIYIKYIFQHQNSNDANVEGFLQKVLTIKDGTFVIDISSLLNRRSSFTDRELIPIYNLAKQNGLSVYINETYTPEERERVIKAANTYT